MRVGAGSGRGGTGREGRRWSGITEGWSERVDAEKREEGRRVVVGKAVK